MVTVARDLELEDIGVHQVDARAANRLTNTALSPEAVNLSFRRGLSQVNRYLENNRQGYANIRRQAGRQEGNLRIISNVGFNQLDQIMDSGRTFSKGQGVPTFRYITPRPETILPRSAGGPIQFIIHSFGQGLDLHALNSSRGVRSIAVDPDTGFNPARFFAGVKQLTSPGSNARVSIHHVISRRGDLVNSASWDDLAMHAGGIKARQLGVNMNARTIGIELEQWFVKGEGNRRVDVLVDLVPYTDEQYTVIAFILKKFMSWTGIDVRNWLGFSVDGLRNIAANVPGCGCHRISALAPGEPPVVQGNKRVTGHHDPGGEFFLPPGFKKGDAIPEFLSNRRTAWEARIERWFGDLPDGTPLSAWDKIFDKVDRLRDFDLQTEVFDTSLVTGTINIETPEVGGVGGSAVAQARVRDRLTGVQRAERMQATSRAELYERASANSATSTQAWTQQTAKVTRVAEQGVKSSVVVNALGFDFDRGIWVRQDTSNSGSEDG